MEKTVIPFNSIMRVIWVLEEAIDVDEAAGNDTSDLRAVLKAFEEADVIHLEF